MTETEKRLAAYRDLFRLDGKTALVLGAASGIGKASAEALAALGATVICADKNKAGAEETSREIGMAGRAEVHVLDAGNAEAVKALAMAIETTHKRLDIAVTTPAIHVRKLMLDYTDEEYDRVADLNLRGTFYFLRAFGRMMVRQGGGSLIASSSVRASTLEPGLAIYGASFRWCAALLPKSDHPACASMPLCQASSRQPWLRR
jgi:NAD(P)-dependent dehydrogenase (short-subunit alcohol dehydrogenase family)